MRARTLDVRGRPLRAPGPRRAAGLVLAALLIGLPAPSAGGVSIALQPATQSVSPGADFDLFVHVTESGSPFNAFDVIVGHVPAALTVLQLSPLSLQEGPLMTAACGSRFHRFRRGSDRDTLTDVLLCSGASVTGPGQIYRLRLRAAMTPQSTTVQILPGTSFFNAGIAVSPITTAGATVVIGGTVDVGGSPGPPAGLRLSAAPNPSRGLTRIRIEADVAGPHDLVVCDPLGRSVRRLDAGWLEPGAREHSWDGRDDSGVRVPAGVYYARLRAASGVVRSPIVRLD